MNDLATSQALPTVVIIVPCFNASTKVRAVLEALEAQTYPRSLYEVLVVDDGSEDDSADIVRSYPRVRLIRQPNGGSYKARNTGIRNSQSEIVVFTDDDCRPEPNWLMEGIRVLMDSRADLVGGRVQLTFQNPESIVELYDVNFHLKQEFYIIKMGWAVTANLFVRRSTIEAVNGFNETARSGADRVFGQSATRAGHKLMYAAQAVVHHPTRPTLSALLKKNRRITYGKALVAYTPWHFLPRDLFKFPPGFHIDRVTALTGARFARFYILYYFVELFRVSCFILAVISIAWTGRRKLPFCGLRPTAGARSGDTA